MNVTQYQEQQRRQARADMMKWALALGVVVTGAGLGYFIHLKRNQKTPAPSPSPQPASPKPVTSPSPQGKRRNPWMIPLYVLLAVGFVIAVGLLINYYYRRNEEDPKDLVVSGDEQSREPLEYPDTPEMKALEAAEGQLERAENLGNLMNYLDRRQAALQTGLGEEVKEEINARALDLLGVQLEVPLPRRFFWFDVFIYLRDEINQMYDEGHEVTQEMYDYLLRAQKEIKYHMENGDFKDLPETTKQDIEGMVIQGVNNLKSVVGPRQKLEEEEIEDTGDENEEE